MKSVKPEPIPGKEFAPVTGRPSITKSQVHGESKQLVRETLESLAAMVSLPTQSGNTPN